MRSGDSFPLRELSLESPTASTRSGRSLVLMLFDAQVFAWANLPIYLLAFIAQVGLRRGRRGRLEPGLRGARTTPGSASDAVALRHRRMPPRASASWLPRRPWWMRSGWSCSPCRSIAYARILLARERRQRLDFGLALSTAYRGTRRSSGTSWRRMTNTRAHTAVTSWTSRSTAAALDLLCLAAARCRVLLPCCMTWARSTCRGSYTDKPGALDELSREVITTTPSRASGS